MGAKQGNGIDFGGMLSDVTNRMQQNQYNQMEQNTGFQQNNPSYMSPMERRNMFAQQQSQYLQRSAPGAYGYGQAYGSQSSNNMGLGSNSQMGNSMTNQYQPMRNVSYGRGGGYQQNNVMPLRSRAYPSYSGYRGY